MEEGMRRLLIVLSVLALCPVGAGSAHAAGAGGSADQFGEADFTVWTSAPHGIWYVAMADRGVSEGQYPSDDAFVARGTCTRNGRGWECHAAGPIHTMAPTEFQMDPTAASADLSYTAGRYVQRVHWTAVGEAPPPAYWYVDPGSAYAFATVGPSRMARATAHLFGKTLHSKRSDFACLSGAGLRGPGG